MDEQKLDSALREYCAPPQIPEDYENAWRSAIKQEEERMKQENGVSNKPNRNFRKLWKILIPVAAAIVLVIGSISAGQFMPVQQKQISDGNGASSVSAAKRSIVMMSTASVKNSAVGDEAVDMVEYEADAPAEASYAAANGSGNSSGLWQETATEKKIIRSASLTLNTQEFDKSLAAVHALVEELGGYLEYSWQYGDGSNDNLRSASMTIRIPQEKLDDFLSRSGELARITEQSQSSVDVSTEYYDNETRLATLRAKLNRLTELMAEAENVEDLITIESAISDTQYSIDSYESTQRSLDSSVTMSSVNLTLQEEKEKEVAAAKEVGFGERISAAFKAGFTALGRFGQNLLVFLTLAAPFILGAAVIGLVVWLILRARKKH